MLSDLIKAFEPYVKTYFDSEESIKECLRYINNFNDYLNLMKFSDLKQVEYNHLLNFTTGGDAGPPTIKARSWAINIFYAFLQLYGHIDCNIAMDLPKIKVPKKEANFLTFEELMLIFNHLAGKTKELNGLRNLLIFALMATLGLRRKSLSELNVEDVDLKYSLIYAHEKGIWGKRAIPLPLVVSDILNEYICENNLKSGPLILSKRGTRLRPDAINKILKNVKDEIFKDQCTKAQLPAKINPHLFRHSAATQLNEAAGFAVTRDVLGHKRDNNTKNYIHLSPSSFGKLMKKHPFHFI